MEVRHCQADQHPGAGEDPPPCPDWGPTSRLGIPPPPNHQDELAWSGRHNGAREIGFYHQRMSAFRNLQLQTSFIEKKIQTVLRFNFDICNLLLEVPHIAALVSG